MPGCPSPLLVVGLTLAGTLTMVAGTTVPAHADDSARHRTVFSFTDPEITESSGLVDAGAVMYTMNDSGHGPQIYAVDKATGNTVATTTYTSDQVVDVEAIAPGRGGDLWVGDIGDNGSRRPTVAVYHVPATAGRLPAQVDAARYDLTYPDMPHNAETLLVHPRTGRVYIVSKALFGGTVYATPAHLRSGTANRLLAFAQVPGLVTDGAFLPDGRHVLLRTYGSATLYSFPGFKPLETMTLPRQKQGEGIAVSAKTNVYVSTEGAHSEVDQVFLPKSLLRALTAVAEAPTSAATGDAAPGSRNPTSGPVSTGVTEGGVWAVVVLAGAGLLFATAARRRSRRRR